MNASPHASPPPAAIAGWGFTVIHYTILTTLGFAAGFFLAALFLLMLHGISKETPPLSEQLLRTLEGGSLFGLILGCFQHSVLHRLVRRLHLAGGKTTLDEIGRRRVRDTAGWIVATVAGVTVCLLIGTAFAEVMPQMSSAWGEAISLGLLGAGLGTAQWLMLRRWAEGAALWIPCTAMSLALAVPAQHALYGLNLTLYGYGPAIIPGVTAGLLLGIFQALCLKRLAARWKGLQTPRNGELAHQDSET